MTIRSMSADFGSSASGPLQSGGRTCDQPRLGCAKLVPNRTGREEARQKARSRKQKKKEKKEEDRKKVVERASK